MSSRRPEISLSSSVSACWPTITWTEEVGPGPLTALAHLDVPQFAEVEVALSLQSLDSQPQLLNLRRGSYKPVKVKVRGINHALTSSHW